MHQHEWTEITVIRNGESVDSYRVCSCGKVLHVYTFVPGLIRYENIHDAESWTAGYAHGLVRGMEL